MIPNVNIPCGEKGTYKIVREYIKPTLQFSKDGRYVPEGEYTFLYNNGKLIMSDTPDEKRDHWEAVDKASGRCLLAGLGIGMVLNAIAMKQEVTYIDVVEISQEVIDLVGEYYSNLYPNKIQYHCASIFDWIPPKEKYNMAWFDIWNALCTDNLEEMKTLHRKYAKRAVWKNSWGKEYLQYRKRRHGW